MGVETERILGFGQSGRQVCNWAYCTTPSATLFATLEWEGAMSEGLFTVSILVAYLVSVAVGILAPR